MSCSYKSVSVPSRPLNTNKNSEQQIGNGPNVSAGSATIAPAARVAYMAVVPQSADEVYSSIQLSSFPTDTMYRCAHCSFVHSDQAKVVTHAKNCPVVTARQLHQEKEIPFTTFNEILTIDDCINDIASSDDDGGVYGTDVQETSVDGRRGRGLPLWSDKKTIVLLDGIKKYAHTFTDDITKLRKSWKLITRYTKDKAKFQVSTKQTRYKWSKLLAEYQDYMANPPLMKQPLFWSRVHAIINLNDKILKKPDLHSYIRTISKMPSDSPSEDPPPILETKVDLKEKAGLRKVKLVDTEEGEKEEEEEVDDDDHDDSFTTGVGEGGTAEVLPGSSLNESLQECAQINIDEHPPIELERELHITLQQVQGPGTISASHSTALRVAREKSNRQRWRVWTNQRIQSLLTVIKRFQSLLCGISNVMVKYAWAVIAAETSKMENFTVTGKQCYAKWKSLINQYVRNNSSSKSQPQHFQWLDSNGQSHPDHGDTVCALYTSISQKKEAMAAGQSGNDPLAGNEEEDSGSWSLSGTDRKSSDVALQRAVHAVTNCTLASTSHGGYRLLFWTDFRVQLLVDTVLLYCPQLSQPGEKSKAIWREIAADVSERGQFSVDYSRCLRKFRNLVKRRALTMKRWPRPCYYDGLVEILSILPPDCKSLPQRGIIKTDKFVEVTIDEKESKGKVSNHRSRPSNHHDEADAVASGHQDDYSDMSEEERDDMDFTYTEPKIVTRPAASATNNNGRNTSRRKRKRSDSYDEDPDVVEYHDRSSNHNSRRKNFSRRHDYDHHGGTDIESPEEESPGKRRPVRRKEQQAWRHQRRGAHPAHELNELLPCLAVLERIERSMSGHQQRIESKLDALITSVTSVEESLQRSSEGVVSFLTGFSRTFDKLTEARLQSSSGGGGAARARKRRQPSDHSDSE